MTMVNLEKNRFDKVDEWQRIFFELAHALLYVHQKKFLHNDIKADNILLTTNDSGLHPVLIDFGKCRKVSNAKWYKLNANKQAKYFKEHWHIAPELVYGTHGQSFASDLFSFGTVMGWVYKSVPLHCHHLKELIRKCINSEPEKRPLNYVVNELHTV